MNDPNRIFDWNPIEIPKNMWEYIAPYMEKYNVEFSETAPDKQVVRPTITWKMIRRTPGDRWNNKPEFSYFDEYRTDDGRVCQIYRANYSCIIEYVIYSKSSSIADDLAWNLEVAVLATNSTIARDYPGYRAKFQEQKNDQEYPDRGHQFETRVIRFLVTVPVEKVVFEPQIRQIKMVLLGEHTFIQEAEVTNLSSESFEVPVSAGIKITGLLLVKRSIPDSNERQLLIETVDYNVAYDQIKGYYIVWIPDGSTPEVNETFWLSYSYATQVMELDNPTTGN